MTRRLLAAFGEVHGSVLLVVTACLVAIVLSPFAIGWDVVAAIFWRLRVASALGAETARCPAGHSVDLTGHWTCSACKLPFSGHAWQDCPHCGAGSRAHAIACACGRVVVSPISPVRR